MFDVQLIESPERIAIVPGVDREAFYVMENKGNAEMQLTVQWETDDMDSGPEERFGVANNIGSTSLTLGVGQTSSFMFTFSATGSDHWQGETGSFTLIRTPVGIDVDPQQDTTQIVVARFKTTGRSSVW